MRPQASKEITYPRLCAIDLHAGIDHEIGAPPLLPIWHLKRSDML
jgi:hypothetical protein